jgi:hypothetical protein
MTVDGDKGECPETIETLHFTVTIPERIRCLGYKVISLGKSETDYKYYLVGYYENEFNGIVRRNIRRANDVPYYRH